MRISRNYPKLIGLEVIFFHRELFYASPIPGQIKRPYSMETPFLLVFLLFCFCTKRCKAQGCAAERSRALGAHRQPKPTPHAGNNKCVPVWRSSIRCRSGVLLSWIYSRTGPTELPRASHRASDTPILVYRCHPDVSTSWSQQSTKLRCKSCKHVRITCVGGGCTLYMLKSRGEVWRSL